MLLLLLGIIGYLLFLSAAQQKNTNPHGEMKIACDQCHTPAGWEIKPKSIKFKHENIGFPLTGNHRVTTCQDCHKSLMFSHVPTACADCHVDVHLGKLGSDCEGCHTPRSWENRSEIFEQHNRSAFPLLGAHALVDCESCHYNQQGHEFTMTEIECKGCHLDNYKSTDNPNHRQAKFAIACEECHTIASVTWHETTYQHSPSFVLTGAHLKSQCSACHTTVFSGTTDICYDCHMLEYNGTSDPNHLAFGFLTDCKICHNEDTWENVIFSHYNISGFDLTGSHQTLTCTQCHLNNQLTDLPRACYGCHENDYNAATDPNHVANNFNHDCSECHSTNFWHPATFDHNLTKFPLTGAHKGRACKDCHRQGYDGISTECYSCHQEDYNSTSDPNHTTAQFPVQCENCHNTNKWDESTLNHDAQFFPIYSGEHRGEWNNCTDCHVDPSNYKKFECINCHSHGKNSMDGEHDDVNGYQYVSTRCYECHPKGREP